MYERGRSKQRDQHRCFSLCRNASSNTHPRTNIPTNPSGFQWLAWVLAAAAVQSLHWQSWLLGHLVAMDKVMPVVGGLASIWVASKTIPVMWLCSTYSDRGVTIYVDDVKYQSQRDLTQLWCYVFPGLLKLHSPKTDMEYGPHRKESRQTNKDEKNIQFPQVFSTLWEAILGSHGLGGPSGIIGIWFLACLPLLGGHVRINFVTWMHSPRFLMQDGCFGWSEQKGQTHISKK